MRAVAVLSTLVLLGLGYPASTVTWHDNRVPAGRMMAGALMLDLEIARGTWYPNGERRAGTNVLAFRERGHGLTTPGPLVRVRLGTRISVSIANTSTDTVTVHGLGSRQGAAVFDSLLVLPGVTVTTSFVADAEGTFFYWGARPGTRLMSRGFDDALLSGALIVDPAQGPIPEDRILMIDVLEELVPSASGPVPSPGTLAINGRPWPLTERLEATVGDSIRWRVINSSSRSHPMHLHGFYFRVDAAGDWQRDTVFDARQQRMAVTEGLAVGSTLDLVWSPDRPGGWLFHCHLSFHAMMNPPVGDDWKGYDAFFARAFRDLGNADAANHVEHHMGGLMLVTNVVPKAGEAYPALRPVARTIRLEVVASAEPDLGKRRYGYRLADGAGSAEPGPAPVLVLEKDQPTDVVIVNTTGEATSIHWHGIEINSYSDGVVGVGGYAHLPTPPIMPADSFVARITAPRTGSFMYHTHVSDLRQQGAGLAGAIVVVDSLEQYDAGHERIYLAQRDLDLSQSKPRNRPAINRQFTLPADTMLAGETYRLRFMNLTLANSGYNFSFTSDRGPWAVWRMAAKDGFDLPAWQQVQAPERLHVSIGETVDVLWTPAPGGSGWLELRGERGNIVSRQRIEVVAD